MRCDSNNLLTSIRLHTDKEGLGMVLGPLELAIMQMLWNETKACTNKEIQYALDREGVEITIPTVGITMQRLAEKCLVLESTHMAGQRRTFTYVAAVTEEDLEVRVVEHVMARIRAAWPDALDTVLGVAYDD